MNTSQNEKIHIVLDNHPDFTLENIEYFGETGRVSAYFAKPKEERKLSGVVVIHENKGLVSHIQDVTRRVALEGFMALAPDALSPLGGTQQNSTDVPTLIQKLDKKTTLKNLVAAVRYLKTHPQSTGKVGVMGFCWGGGMANQVTVNSPDVTAMVSFYGMQPAAEEVTKIQASILLHYADKDERINQGIQAYKTALQKAHIEYKIFTYPGTEHAFFNDTSQRYNQKAAKLAWKRTLSFFKQKLS